jgi:hypothetical protein
MAAAVTAVIAAMGIGAQKADDAPKKRIIGATAVLTEVNTGLPFAARIDTGAESCSLHVEKIEIKDESPRPIQNLGKSIRFLVKNEKGDKAWTETTISSVVRIRSSAQKEGEFDRRYKVRLSLRWEEFRKEVLVTLNDRTEMAYPLLIGRNFLRGDFLVDVEKDSPE